MINKMPRGFALVETLVVLGILTLLLGAVVGFQQFIFRQNGLLQNRLLADQDARATLRLLIAELRAAAPSELGAYPLAGAGTSSIAFFSDSDSDGTYEQLRYFLDGTELKRGLTRPVGEPLAYNPANETISVTVRGLAPAGASLFSYYDEGYAGTTTPLTLPINLPLVRLIQVSLPIDLDPNRPPGPAVYQSQVVIRSLKENL